MKKKIVSMCAVVALATVAVGGATLAYFTDADADRNVMTSGNVQIVQNETDRNGKAWQEDGIAELLPAVYLKADGNGNMVPYAPATTTEGPGGYGPQTVGGKEMWYTGTMNDTDGEGTLKIYDGNIENEVDKVISVTNEGSEDAYVRTIILVENDSDNKIWNKIHCLWCNNDGQYRKWVGADGSVKIGEQTYSVAVCTYDTPLASGATTSPSLMQLFLDPSTTNDWYDLLGDGKLEIIAISQAAQEAGFDNASQALDTAFGKVTSENVVKWLQETGIDTDGAANVVGGVATQTPAQP